MIVGKKYEEYMVVADGFIKIRGSFKRCKQWCDQYEWMHDAFKEILIVKVVANGKAL